MSHKTKQEFWNTGAASRRQDHGTSAMNAGHSHKSPWCKRHFRRRWLAKQRFEAELGMPVTGRVTSRFLVMWLTDAVRATRPEPCISRDELAATVPCGIVRRLPARQSEQAPDSVQRPPRVDRPADRSRRESNQGGRGDQTRPAAGTVTKAQLLSYARMHMTATQIRMIEALPNDALLTLPT